VSKLAPAVIRRLLPPLAAVLLLGGGAHAQSPLVCDGLGLRQFTVARPPSGFLAAALQGADISSGDWMVDSLDLCAGEEQGDGLHPLTLTRDVILGIPTILPGFVACVQILAEGSSGQIDCDGGTSLDVRITQNSHGADPEDPPVIESGLGEPGRPGDATLFVDASVRLLTEATSPEDCLGASFEAVIPFAMTTATGEQVIDEPNDLLGHLPQIRIEATGQSFECAAWTETDSAGVFIAPLAALDMPLVGDTAAILELADTPEGGGELLDERFYMTDDRGRARVFHGVNVTDDRRTPPDQFSTTEEDYQRIASWGFNLVRLSLFWESLEPTRGSFDQAYLDRVGDVLDWAHAAGLDVILDFHQDVYGPPYGRGLPAWSARTDGEPFEPQGEFFNNYHQPAVKRAFDHFYGDQDLQDAYAVAWMKMIDAYGGHPALLGYDLMNEPYKGSAGVEEFESTILPTMYEYLAGIIRMADPERWIGYEPYAFTTVPGQPSHLPVMDIERATYMPHMYHPQLEFGDPYNPDIDDYLAKYSAERVSEAAAQGAPLIIGEWGADMFIETAPLYVRDALDALDGFASGWTWWVYHRDGRWGILDGAGQERPVLDLLVRTYPQRIAGDPQGFSFNADTRDFELVFAEAEGVTGPTEISVPMLRVYPEGFSLEVSDGEGGWVASWDPGREVLSVTTDAGQAEHTIRISPCDPEGAAGCFAVPEPSVVTLNLGAVLSLIALHCRRRS